MLQSKVLSAAAKVLKAAPKATKLPPKDTTQAINMDILQRTKQQFMDADVDDSGNLSLQEFLDAFEGECTWPCACCKCVAKDAVAIQGER